MTTPTLPYFFDEAELAATAKQTGNREKALGFSIDDLNWLKVVYLPTQTARKAHAKPMQVDRLMLTQPDATDIPLAGAFAMSRPGTGEVTLYTPWQGLLNFADMDKVKSKIKEWLAQDTGKRELLRFLTIGQRNALAETPDVSTAEIDGPVFQDQELTLEQNQAQNIQAMIGELVQIPSLQSMLDESLKNALRKAFPTLDQRLVRMNSVVSVASGIGESGYQHTLSSLSLSEALLHLYLYNQWPEGDARRFTHPRHGVSSDADNQTWENVIREIAQSLTPHLQSLLETFWNTPMNHGQSRSSFFSEGMRDAYHLNLFLLRRRGTLTTKEYLRLMNVSLAPDPQAPLRIEKVRVTAPFKHYAELASTLMIGSNDTLGFLYTQSRGIEATTDLSAVRDVVLEMLKSEGHEDSLLNFMSLDERSTLLSLESDERMIIGQPIIGPVFEQLMAGILHKQRSNLSHALSRFRGSEGTQDPHALVDNALDIRALIDNRLLVADVAGRWSTHADQRWNAQPATVRAESAKAQLALLSSVEQALDQRLDNHPALPTTTRTLTEAQPIVARSIAGLQSSFMQTLSTALRSELNLRTVSRTLGATEQAIIKTVLDTPVRLQRAALNGFLPDVFALALQAGEAPQPLRLASCFVLTERGGLDPMHSGKAILWTPAAGFETFKALTPLLRELERRLKDNVDRLTLLENLGRSERLPGRAYSLAPLQRLDGHFLDYIQKPYVCLDQAGVTNALATQLAPAPLASLLKLVALRKPLTGLRRATDIAQCLTTQQKLPAWLANASVNDQVLHAELLQQYFNNVTDDQDYLSGLRALSRTAHHQLQAQLKADNFNIDPDKVQIRISDRSITAASTETLTRFALTHFKDLDKVDFTIASLDTTPIPQEMNQTYVKTLIRNLKLGEHQQAILNDAFADTHADSTLRRQRFYTQLPWQLMHYAHGEKLQERLSETGFDLIRQVMDMPDAIARAAVDGAHAMIRPLELNGVKSTQTIKVPGIYLIGSLTDSAAPQVLIAPHSPGHGIKEYDSETQLLTELIARGGLLDWVLVNLPQSDRTLLEQWLGNAGNRVTRSTPAQTDAGAVTLASNPIKGNLFKRLFDDNLELLIRLLGCQSDDNHENEWTTIKNVLGEDLREAYSFFSGKLAYPLTVWRSYREFKQSAEDLQTHKWGAAVKEFVSGIAQLAALRESIKPLAALASAPPATTPPTTSTRFRWNDVDITAPERTRLKRHEPSDIDLGSLTLDSKLGLYTDSSSKKHYAPVEGKVYAVAKHTNRWRISDAKKPGPYLRQINSTQWTLDRAIPLPRFGLTKQLQTALSVRDGINVDAYGMPAIRRLFPQKARAIEEALEMATSYAWNAFRNLQLLKSPNPTDSAVHHLIMKFLGVETVLPAHVEKIEKVLSDIFAGLLDPTLQQAKSERFVVGRVRHGAAYTYGFTIPTDAKKKIYLGERFFDPLLTLYRGHLCDSAFPIDTHARAATLIHELSHVICETEDIAYLDTVRPFADLIGTASVTASDMKHALSTLQDTALSINTPYTQLFMLQNSETGEWEDPGGDEDSRDIKNHLLTLTGADNLAGARTKFKKDALVRLAVQLSNADSVTWLITHLGRQLHVTTP